jgi:hypothetical protein
VLQKGRRRVAGVSLTFATGLQSGAAQVLDGMLAEERAGDAKLNTLAEGGINEQAAAGVNTEQNNDAAGRSGKRASSSGASGARSRSAW